MLSRHHVTKYAVVLTLFLLMSMAATHNKVAHAGELNQTSGEFLKVQGLSSQSRTKSEGQIFIEALVTGIRSKKASSNSREEYRLLLQGQLPNLEKAINNNYFYEHGQLLNAVEIFNEYYSNGLTETVNRADNLFVKYYNPLKAQMPRSFGGVARSGQYIQFFGPLIDLAARWFIASPDPHKRQAALAARSDFLAAMIGSKPDPRVYGDQSVAPSVLLYARVLRDTNNAEESETLLWDLMESYDRRVGNNPAFDNSILSDFLKGKRNNRQNLADSGSITGDPLWLISLRESATTLAEIYTDRGWYEDAEVLISAAVSSAVPKGTDTAANASGDSRALPGLLLLKTRICRLQNNMPCAIDSFNWLTKDFAIPRSLEPTYQIESLYQKASLQGIDSLEQEVNAVLDLFNNQIRTASSATGGKFEVSQLDNPINELLSLARSKLSSQASGRVLIKAQQILNASRIAFAARRSQVEVQITSDDVNRALVQEFYNNIAQMEVLEQSLTSLATLTMKQTSAQELESLVERQRQIYDNLPEKIRDLLAIPVSPAQTLSSSLNTGDVLLMYTVQQNSTLASLLTPDGTIQQHVIELDSATLQTTITKYRNDLLVDSLSIAQLQTKGNTLYRLLTGPFESTINDATRLTIVADGPLLVLPFAALTVQNRQAKNENGYAWLGTEKAIRLLPNASELQSKPTKATSRYLGIGAPDTEIIDDTPISDGNENNLLRTVTKHTLCSQLYLSGAKTELENAEKVFGMANSTLLIGAMANEAEVRKGLKEQVDVVHFATHTILSDEHLPGLVLDPDCSNNSTVVESANDGFLAANEIANMQLNNSLVVLSACETAAGASEGLSGLARAFRFAGAGDLIVTHWNIDDQASEVIVTDMLTQIAKFGVSPDIALRDIFKQIVQNTKWAHPRFWAAFFLVGSGTQTL